MEFFKLEKPKSLSESDKIAIIEAFDNVNTRADVSEFVKKANSPEYRYWDAVKHQKPLPAGLTPEQAWYVIKMTRALGRQKSPITTEDDHTFTWFKLSDFEKVCHEFDLHTGGELMVSFGELKTDERKRLISKGLMDEAIASAQLEGADTSRKYAQKMLREKIKPRNISEQMILNSHRAMLEVDKNYKHQSVSYDLLLEMHSLLTEDTVDSEGEPPRLRRVDDEPVRVQDELEGIIYHESPSVSFVKGQLKRFVDFANDMDTDEEFLHPIIKATILHFWIGYLHPFTDGNGRLARLLFYWYLLHHGYWAFAYLPIAAKIKTQGKKGYTMAYVYSEQDDYDFTYFISYILRKSSEAHQDFQKYLKLVRKSNAEMAFTVRTKLKLNDRQIQLIKYLSADSENTTTVSSYISVNRVSRATAVSDLKNLVNKKLVGRKKVGRTVYYFGTKPALKLIE